MAVWPYARRGKSTPAGRQCRSLGSSGTSAVIVSAYQGQTLRQYVFHMQELSRSVFRRIPRF